MEIKKEINQTLNEEILNVYLLSELTISDLAQRFSVPSYKVCEILSENLNVWGLKNEN